MVQSMKNKIFLILSISSIFLATFLLVICFNPNKSLAKESAPKDSGVEGIVNRLQGWYDKLSDFEADFNQKTFSQTLKSTSDAFGKVYFKKPNLIKWDYQSPEPQLYLIDHEHFWWYVPDDAQVVKKKASKVLEDTTPLSFLAGIGNLKKSFIIVLPENSIENIEKRKFIILDLTPRQKQNTIKEMQLRLEAKTCQIRGLILVDHYGNTNEIDFTNMKVNQGIKEDIFHFVPPEGTDIIDEEAEQTAIPSTNP